MQKEKSVKQYTRRTKSGKTVTVHAYKAKYDAAEELKKAMAKKAGAGKELMTKKQVAPVVKEPDYGFTADEFKEWYHWDTEADAKNKAALKVEKALKASMGARGYKKFYDEMTDGYSTRGHNKAFKGLGDRMSATTARAEAPKKEKATVTKKETSVATTTELPSRKGKTSTYEVGAGHTLHVENLGGGSYRATLMKDGKAVSRRENSDAVVPGSAKVMQDHIKQMRDSYGRLEKTTKQAEANKKRETTRVARGTSKEAYLPETKKESGSKDKSETPGMDIYKKIIAGRGKRFAPRGREAQEYKKGLIEAGWTSQRVKDSYGISNTVLSSPDGKKHVSLITGGVGGVSIAPAGKDIIKALKAKNK